MQITFESVPIERLKPRNSTCSLKAVSLFNINFLYLNKVLIINLEREIEANNSRLLENVIDYLKYEHVDFTGKFFH